MGCLHLASTDAELAQLRQTAQQQQSDGPGRAEFLDSTGLHDLEPALSPAMRGGLRVPGGNVENRRLCRALEIAARRAGVRIETGVEVQAITTTGGRVTGVVTAPQSLPGDLVVLAAGAWSATIREVRPTPPVAPQRGQIFALDHSSVGIKHVLLTSGDPYFVPRCDGRLVIGATREEAGWDPSLTVGGVAWLFNRAIEVVPALRGCPIVEMWTGFRPSSADGLPLIGRGEVEGLFFLTGHGPSGIAPLPGSVALLMALIAGEPPPLSPEPFDPLRFAAR
jgi:glycine oxidase